MVLQMCSRYFKDLCPLRHVCLQVQPSCAAREQIERLHYMLPVHAAISYCGWYCSAGGIGRVCTLRLSKLIQCLRLQDGTLPDTLAAICNSIRFEPASANFTEYCQGFVYDVRQQVAFFKAQPDNRLLGVKDMCSNPTTYTWLHTQGRPTGHTPHDCIPSA